MNRNRHALMLAVALALALLAAGRAATFVTSAAASAPAARQSEPQRRPRGPATGPSIPLPRGQGEGLEQPAADGQKVAPASPRRWEYCAITHTLRRQAGFGSSPATFFAVVRYYPNTGEEVEGKDEDDALANALSKLGEEGWELVAVRQNLNLLDGSGKATHTYLFKRPK
jgi:hypothetical protein